MVELIYCALPGQSKGFNIVSLELPEGMNLLESKML